MNQLGRSVLISITVAIICSVGIAVFLIFYFLSYQSSYMRGEIFDISDGWQYATPQTEPAELDRLTAGPKLKSGETLSLYKTLDIDITQAAVLIHSNHQNLSVYIDDVPLYTDTADADAGAGPATSENPGIALRLLPLPDDYLGKTLKIELTSPYASYSGRTSPVLMGTVSSLEAYTHSESLRPLIMMVICLAVWVPMTLIGLFRGTDGKPSREQLAAGVFAIFWALFFVSSEYDVFTFFTPVQRSVFSMGMYFSLSVPLSLFFYFSFERYKRHILPLVIFHCAFTAAALGLQLFGLVDLPRIITLNNIAFAAGGLYSNILVILEAKKGNRIMKLTAPFLFITYSAFMFFYLYVFCTKQDAASFYYRDFYFLLVLAILVYSIWHFSRDVYRQKRENELLAMRERLMRESYENFRTHLRETAGLKHDMKNHFAAILAYMERGRIEQARDYLTSYAGQSAAVTDTAYSEHLLLNAVVSSLYQRAFERGVKVQAHLSAIPAHIADTDLYSLLSNITDNALEACMAMPEGTERFVRLTVTKREPYLNITCTNSRSGAIVSAQGKIQTTKTGDGHGYGLWLIGRIAKSYDGMMNIEYDADSFTVMVALKDK